MATAWEERREWGRAAATRVLKQLQLDETPVDPIQVAERLGLEVCFEQLDDGVSGRLETRNGTTRIIVNPYESRRRQRFTIAHEIGHFLDGELSDVARDGESSPKEYGCNEFAASLLMPQDWFLSDVSRNLSDGELSAIYDMSVPAVQIRRKALKS